MQLKLKTLLNFKEKHSHFVYQDVRLNEAGILPQIEITVIPRQVVRAFARSVISPVLATTA